MMSLSRLDSLSQIAVAGGSAGGTDLSWANALLAAVSPAAAVEPWLVWVLDAVVVVGAVLFTVVALRLVRANRRLAAARRALESELAERRRAEERLSDRDEVFRAISESALDAIVMVDDLGRISYWNPAAEAIFGWSEAEALGRDPHDFVAAPELRPKARQAAAGFRSSGEGAVIDRVTEVEAIHRDGHRFPVEISVSAVLLGGAWHAVGIVRDVTERVRHREALEQATREAEVAAGAKAQFLANMSHEIRTPLNAVIGLSELLLDTELHTLQREYAELVHSSGESLLALVNDILDFSKVESGSLELERIRYDPRAVVEDVGDVLGFKAANKGVELVLLISPEVPVRVEGDPARLRQVLTNLVSNAVKFTSEGEVVVQLEAAGDAASPRLRFAVRDTGIGIPPERQEAIFESFAQVDASMTRRYGGTGLGLAISQRLVELMDGALEVESTPGEGSVFSFEIAAPEVRVDDAPRQPDPATLAPGLRVLVIDDNATNRRLLRELVLRWRGECVEAASGPEGLERLADDGPFDLVLLDYAMPEMDGETVARKIRASEGGAGPPVILLTSAPRPGDAPRMEAAGIDAYLTKPVKRDLLLDAVLRVLEGTAASREAAPGRQIVTRHTLAERLEGSPVLVVEDHEVNLKVIVRLLERLNLRCDVARDGAEAVRACAERPYELVLMDCQMPAMDGYEATRRIREAEGPDRRVPVVALTAEALDGDRERCLAAGMDDYLAKPVTIEKLQAALAKWLAAPEPGPVEPLRTAPPAPAPVDRDRLRAVAGDDERFQAHLCRLFLGECASQLDEIGGHLESAETEGIRLAAHGLKGAAGNIGADELRRIAAELESAARDGEIGRCRRLLGRLRHEAAAVEAYLADEVLASAERPVTERSTA